MANDTNTPCIRTMVDNAVSWIRYDRDVTDPSELEVSPRDHVEMNLETDFGIVGAEAERLLASARKVFDLYHDDLFISWDGRAMTERHALNAVSEFHRVVTEGGTDKAATDVACDYFLDFTPSSWTEVDEKAALALFLEEMRAIPPF